MDVLDSSILTRTLLQPGSEPAITVFQPAFGGQPFGVAGVAGTPLAPIGADWLWTVPARFASGGLLLKAVCAKLTTSDAAGQRPVLVLDDGERTLAESVGAADAQAPSTTCTYTWAPGFMSCSSLQGSGEDVHACTALPFGLECLLKAGWRVRTQTTGLDVTSQWSDVLLYAVGAG